MNNHDSVEKEIDQWLIDATRVSMEITIDKRNYSLKKFPQTSVCMVSLDTDDGFNQQCLHQLLYISQISMSRFPGALCYDKSKKEFVLMDTLPHDTSSSRALLILERLCNQVDVWEDVLNELNLENDIMIR